MLSHGSLTELHLSKRSASRCSSSIPTYPGSVSTKQKGNELKADILFLGEQLGEASWSMQAGFQLLFWTKGA